MDDDLPRKVLQVVRKDAVFPAAGAKRAKGVFRVDVVFEAMEQAGQPPADFRRVEALEVRDLGRRAAGTHEPARGGKVMVGVAKARLPQGGGRRCVFLLAVRQKMDFLEERFVQDAHDLGLGPEHMPAVGEFSLRERLDHAMVADVLKGGQQRARIGQGLPEREQEGIGREGAGQCLRRIDEVKAPRCERKRRRAIVKDLPVCFRQRKSAQREKLRDVFLLRDGRERGPRQTLPQRRDILLLVCKKSCQGLKNP